MVSLPAALANKLSLNNGNGSSNGHSHAVSDDGDNEQQLKQSNGVYAQSDESIWQKANANLMYTGVPWTPVLIRKAKGTMLYDANGKEILDFTSGQMSSILGHSHPAIVEVVKDSVSNLDHLLTSFISEPVADLANNLCALLPDPLDKTFFLNTGSEVNEAAIKIAKCSTGKFEIIAFSSSYHGLTGLAGAATFTCGRSGTGPTMPGQLVFPTPNAFRSPFRKPDGSYDWEAEMKYGWDLIDRQTVGSLCAFIVEPILSTGGIIELPLGYLTKLHEECKKRGMLLIVDEAQTGCGRTGDLWAFQRDNIVPDIVTLSKTLGAGLPLAAVVTTTQIATAASKGGFFWITTHQGDPLTAAVGVKVLEVVIKEDLTSRAAHMGKILRAGLMSLKDKYPTHVGDIRGRGLLQGLEVVAAPGNTSISGEKLGGKIADKAMDLGLSCNITNLPGLASVFRIAPPLLVEEEELHRAIDILDRAFAFVLKQEGL